VNKPIDNELAYFLRLGPTTAKELARLIGKSESRMREILKQHQDEIQCKKNEAGTNVFWLPSDQAADEGNAPAADTATIPAAAPSDASDQSGTDGQVSESACPLCGATDGQEPAGAEGTFLGSAKTCGTCGKTYNIHSGEEVTMPAKGAKAKRTPLNPQYKINAKCEAATAAKGQLVFDKEARQWVLTKKGMDPVRMTAKEFSIETPETITAKLS
jgi:ssDNA-binding Zn-finger/Zn-ribbon topoisomerase 1